MSCPVCEKRTAQEQKAASDCKQEVKQLETKSARLTIVLTVLSTLVGKELLDEALALTDSIVPFTATTPIAEAVVVEAAAQDSGDADTQDRPEERLTVVHSVPSLTSSPSFLSGVPALTPRLYDSPVATQIVGLSFSDNVMVPDTAAPLFLTALLRPWTGRRRND